MIFRSKTCFSLAFSASHSILKKVGRMKLLQVAQLRTVLKE